MSVAGQQVRETGREYALRMITDRIIALTLAPGSMVSENELAAQLRLSRTPVREALIELSRLRIVTVYPKRGSSIALIEYDLVEEARFMRYLLEMDVIRQVCLTAQPGEAAQLQRNVRFQAVCLENHDPVRLMQLDNAFHKCLFDIARKPMVYQLMHAAQIHFDRVRMMSLEAVKDTKIVADHQEMLEAVLKHDAAAAQAVMDRHLSRYQIDEQALRSRYPEYFDAKNAVNG